MRRVIVSMNITLDGFMAGIQWGLEWHFQYWNEEMAEAAAMQLSEADTLLLGRKTYEAMAGYWPVQYGNIFYPRQDMAFAEMMNQCHKVVFSKTLRRLGWNNSSLAKSGIEKEVMLLKEQAGKNILVYGSGTIVSSLMRSGLVDEYQLWVHPVFLREGQPFFKDKKNERSLELMDKKIFGSGVVLFFYRDAGWK